MNYLPALLILLFPASVAEKLLVSDVSPPLKAEQPFKTEQVSQQLQQWLTLSLALEGYSQSNGDLIKLGACLGDQGEYQWWCKISLTRTSQVLNANAICPMSTDLNGEVAIGGLCEIIFKDKS